MAAAAMFEIQVHAINGQLPPDFAMKIGTQTKKSMLS
jgi:hypothetical protein